MSAETIVSRLEFCKQSGPDSWIARCPSHDDRGPSLSIKDAGGGRTLIHCHAGCGALDVLTALGLDWDALYPPTDRNYKAEKRQHERSVDELVVEIALADMASGKTLSREDRDRAAQAMKRLDNNEPSPPGDDMNAAFLRVAKRYAEKTQREMERLAVLGDRN